MIDINDLPKNLRWAKRVFPILYLLYILLISSISLLAAVVTIFDFDFIPFPGDISKPSTEVVALLAMAALLPLVPFVGELALPGGAGFKLANQVRDVGDRVTTTLDSSLELAKQKIATLELPDLPKEGPQGQ